MTGKMGEFICDRCGHKLKSNQSLLRHISAIHENCSNSKLTKRKIKYFSPSMAKKRKLHSSRESFLKCNYPKCAYQTTRTGNLRRHIQAKHTGAHKHCTYCNYSTKSAASFKKHLKHHSGIKSHSFTTGRIIPFPADTKAKSSLLFS